MGQTIGFIIVIQDHCRTPSRQIQNMDAVIHLEELGRANRGREQKERDRREDHLDVQYHIWMDDVMWGRLVIEGK